jgi:hypothetical protein
MERFACGYCGAEMFVQRRGGTVALKAVTDAIKKVAVGTDKMAAEMTMARLNQESSTASEELQKMFDAKSGVASGSKNVGCVAGVSLIGGVFVLFIASRQSSGHVDPDGFALVCFFGLALIGFAIYCYSRLSHRGGREERIDKQIVAKQAELAAVKGRIAQYRSIVD